MKLFEEFIAEKANTYSYGCVMLNLDTKDLLSKAKEIIDEDDLYFDEVGGYGLEDEHHCTLLYGLHDEVTKKQIKEVVNSFKYSDVIAHNCSLFENDKYDVLKFDVKCANESESFLEDCNAALRKLPHTTNFPDYHAHMTIAYIKKGKAKAYCDKFEKTYQISPTNIIYSLADKTKINIEI